MSPLLKLIACTVVLAAGGGAALAAGSVPARTDSHMIVCPLEPNSTITIPCCGPPIVTAASSAFICCGTPQPIACPIGLTLASSSDPSVAGQKVTLTGRWPGGTTGQTVVLWQRLPGAKQFTKVGQTNTGSLGDFQFVRTGITTNREWYVTVGSERSLTVAQQVKAVVTFSSSLLVHVSPDHAGERVLIQQRMPHAWVVTLRPRLDRSSSVQIQVGGHGGFDLRAVFPGDKRNTRSASRVLTAP